MATHISARLAWHQDGWDGRICKCPSCNAFCIGQHSYPGTIIRENRDIDWESEVAGEKVMSLDELPPCRFSINAYGEEPIDVYDDPPSFFSSGARIKWQVPPYSFCVWPYEEMYREEVKTNGYPDAEKRKKYVDAFFDEIEPGKSLVFTYANYSNPLSTDDQKRYLVVGVSRISELGSYHFYPGLNDNDMKKYGGFVWQKSIHTNYLEEGFRIPYHLYLDDTEVLNNLAVFPDNDRCFKYASRHMSDDDALSLVERFIEVAHYLKDELNDNSEDWSYRLDWLNRLISELWKSRGLYPGFPAVLSFLGMSAHINEFHHAVEQGEERYFVNRIHNWLEGNKSSDFNLKIDSDKSSEVRKIWNRYDKITRKLLFDIIPRFDIEEVNVKRIISKKREEWGIQSSLEQIYENPFLLCEQYEGNGPDDRISYAKIEHGVYPSPELGDGHLYLLIDWRRLRALTVDQLKKETKHVFLPVEQILESINTKLSLQPGWKTASFEETDFFHEDEQKRHEESLVFSKREEKNYLYLREVYESERSIDGQVRELQNRPEISFRSPITEETWHVLLEDPNSPAAKIDAEKYRQAIQSQAHVCNQIFRKPIAIVNGSAGTGKTTVVKSIIKAIEKAHGEGTSFQLLAPTGKAADRLREQTEKEATTIHSFLAKHGWLRENFTFKEQGGTREENISTYIIDECSMLELELFAALIRSINWNTVQRLILVGDPNQLPPIGRGRVFADVIDWLGKTAPESVGTLNVNLRQLENLSHKKGTGILDLARIFTRNQYQMQEFKDEEESIHRENMLQRIQDLPPDGQVDRDLRVVYWSSGDELHRKLLEYMRRDIETDSKIEYDPDNPWKLWSEGWKTENGGANPLYQQVISPYRADQYGTEVLNSIIQTESKGNLITRLGLLDGITLFDKVIQYRNRGKSDAIEAYNHTTRKKEKVSVFNGELGITTPPGFDSRKWRSKYYSLKYFAVRFSRKEHLAVNYGKLYKAKEEKPEDNLELAYAISVHKSQGSEFKRVYFVLPKKTALLSPELIYTGLTRASDHCTVFIEDDISPILSMTKPLSSHLIGINSSLFDFREVPQEYVELQRQRRESEKEEEQNAYLDQYRIHKNLADMMVRSKSEVIISNILFERDIPFFYEKPLYAEDGTFYLPDFTIMWRGEEYYWEHLGMLDQEKYKKHWEVKERWYESNFPGKLIITRESGDLSKDSQKIIEQFFM